MNFLVTLFMSVINYVKLVFSGINIPAFIYDNCYTKPLTKYTYYALYDRMLPTIGKYKKILDVGTGTGEALQSISERFSADTSIVGIDIDKNYILKATKRFEKQRNVRIREQNFYELAGSKEKYDAIIFSSSFMLMPDRNKALEVAKGLLNPGGKIFFLMTLYNKKKKFIEKVKPYLKYYTTIDFGSITYEWEFDQLLAATKLQTTFKERIIYKFNPILLLFRLFIIECSPQA